MLILYTDALTEAPNQNGQMHGEDGLLELANSIARFESAAEFGRLLRKAAQQYSGGVSTDDETLVVFRFGQGRPSPGLMERLQGYASVVLGR